MGTETLRDRFAPIDPVVPDIAVATDVNGILHEPDSELETDDPGPCGVTRQAPHGSTIAARTGSSGTRNCVAAATLERCGNYPNTPRVNPSDFSPFLPLPDPPVSQ